MLPGARLVAGEPGSPSPARNRRASPPSSRHDASQAAASVPGDGSVQPRSPSATWPPAAITNASAPPPAIECTRPELRPPARIDAELNRAPTASAATACPASCHAVATASLRAGAYVSAKPPWYRCLIQSSCTTDSSSYRSSRASAARTDESVRSSPGVTPRL